jgi:Tfp pilus assembly protein FimV
MVRRRVRLTRRGRAVAAGLCLLLVLLMAAVAAPASQAGGPPTSPAHSTPREPEVAVVQPGDTLWSIVARHAPSRDAPSVIDEIRRLNRLSGNTIHPGQRLILPDLPEES